MILFSIKKQLNIFNKIFLNKKIISVYLFSIILYFPPTWIYFGEGNLPSRLQLMMTQAVDPFNVDYSNYFFDNVLAYRIVIPLFNYFLGLRGFWIIFPSLLGSYLLLIISSRILERYHNAFNSTILLISLSTSYLFVSGTNFWEANDSLAIAIVLLVVLSKRFWMQSILIFLAISIDERCVFSILLLPLLIKSYQDQSIIKLKEVFLYYLRWMPGFLCAFFLRLLVTNGIIFSSPLINYQYHKNYNLILTINSYHPKNIAYVLIQWFLSIRWLWFYIIFFSLDLLSDFKKKFYIQNKFNLFNSNYTSILYFFTLILTYFLSNLFVGDVWRCALYLFPVLYSAILMIKESQKTINKIALSLMILMILTPQFYLGNFSSLGTKVVLNISSPLPLVLIRTFF